MVITQEQQERNMLAMMQAAPNKNAGKLPADCNMNDMITTKRVKLKGVKDAWRHERVPQYGLQNRTKVRAKFQRYTDEFGDTQYREYDGNDKLVGDTGIQ